MGDSLAQYEAEERLRQHSAEEAVRHADIVRRRQEALDQHAAYVLEYEKRLALEEKEWRRNRSQHAVMVNNVQDEAERLRVEHAAAVAREEVEAEAGLERKRHAKHMWETGEKAFHEQRQREIDQHHAEAEAQWERFHGEASRKLAMENEMRVQADALRAAEVERQHDEDAWKGARERKAASRRQESADHRQQEHEARGTALPRHSFDWSTRNWVVALVVVAFFILRLAF